jgi:hypothetical protein
MIDPAMWRRARAFLTDQPFYWREAGLCAPAIPLLLLAGVWTHQLAYAAVATGAAFSVGFGAARDLRGRRWGAMIAATAGVTAAAFIGCLAGQWLPALIGLAAIAAMGCALLALVDEDLWWISLQMVIALLVGGFYPGPPHAALPRAAAVLGGGSIQIVVVVVLARLAPAAAQRLPAKPPPEAVARSLYISHAVRAAVCVGASLWIAHQLALANGYWAPMTAMLVLKPGLSETNTRGLARLTGTIVGGAAATLYVLIVGYGWPWLVVGVGAAATAAFALQKAHYAILTSAITATIVLVLSLAEAGHALANAEHRLIATLVGGAMALIAARILPHYALAAAPGADRVGRTVAAAGE